MNVWKKVLSKVVYVSFAAFLLAIVSSLNASATSWVELEAQEVYDQADVIVKGVYDFSRSPTSVGGSPMFEAYPFRVEHVYKGEARPTLTAGVETYDVALAKQFQEDGGEFLLFLERNGQVHFMTPVGGPNGMVQLVNGEIYDQNEQNDSFYQQILSQQPKAPKTKTTMVWIQFGLGLVLLLILLARIERKDRSSINRGSGSRLD
ncbi:hypothetical protein BEP19_12295 [Ammoniphilus oxalaticus]|uniref:Gram-positive cocci surface proteins LPxTG domain-containing protein n=1 Tax=Ammoniphilus oxalaticus TaxID=66863 RepID=A0A419SGT1_9BACL|nr:hypothetical protein [Ammoniphilus oxalaticus]RKD23004.1 hypothetical protein BEP19_12295 [Ammoniphilus oxalaticus]